MVVIVQAAFGPEISNRSAPMDLFRLRLGLLRGFWKLHLLDQLGTTDPSHHGAQVGELKRSERVLRPPLQERGRKVRQAAVMRVFARESSEKPAHFCWALLRCLDYFARNLVGINLSPRGALDQQQLGPARQMRPEGIRLQNSALELIPLKGPQQGTQQQIAMSEMPQLLPSSRSSARHGQTPHKQTRKRTKTNLFA